MNIVYLGIFSSVYNWVFDKILSPVVSFVSSLLSTVLSWLFDSVLKPLLINVIWPLFENLVNLVIDIFAQLLYDIYACMLTILDTLQLAFDIFAGLEPVTVIDSTNAAITEEMSLLEAVFQLDMVQTVLWAIILIGFALTFFTAILAVMKSMGDLNEQSRPVSKVIASTMKAMLMLVCIPALSVFLITLSCSVLTSIDTAFAYGSGSTNTDENPSMAAMVWVVSSLEAATDSDYNASTAGSGIVVGSTDKLRAPFYSGTSDYTNTSAVGNSFAYAEFDYLVGGAGVLFLVFALLIVLLGFIRRIFDVILLIIAAPFFVAFMPIDDGEKFKSWQDLFMGKLFGGYGAVMAMEMYLIIAPSVMGGDISFGDGSVAANYLIRLVFLIGGGWAVVQAGPAITQLISFQAGQAESQNAAAVTSVARFAYNKYDENRKEKRADRKADARDARNRSMSGGGGGGGGGGYSGPTGIGDAGSMKGAPKPKQTPLGARSKINGGASGTHIYQGADGKYRTGVNMGKSFVRGEKADGTRVNRFMGFGSNKDAKGNRTKIRTPLGSFKKDENGKWKLNKVNLGVYKGQRGTDGKMHATKVNLGVAKFRPGNDGKMTLTRLNLGAAKFRRAQQVSVDNEGKRTKGAYGDMFCSQVAGKVNRSYNWDKKDTQTDSAFGVKVHRFENSDKEKKPPSSTGPAAPAAPKPPAAPAIPKPTVAPVTAGSSPLDKK